MMAAAVAATGVGRVATAITDAAAWVIARIGGTATGADGRGADSDSAGMAGMSGSVGAVTVGTWTASAAALVVGAEGAAGAG